jgi:CHAT domain-containing protein
LVLENDERQSHLVDADDMQVLLQGSSVKLCVLSACQTAATDASDAIMGVAPKLVWTGVPAVIAMQFVVPDKTAISFMHDFYEFLADGRPLDSAVTEARIGVYFDNDDKVFWGIPVLFMRAPDGVIWKRG